MTIERAKLIQAIDCCLTENGCDMCPLMDECCDVPFIPFSEVPVEMLERIRKDVWGRYMSLKLI